MFVRKKRNPSGIISVQIIDKSHGKYRMVETVGSSSDPDEVEVNITLDREKIDQAKRWDGLKGYLTNCNLNGEEVISNYAHLWKIEKAFRISKTDLRVRPVFHYLKRRIEAHICISFCAYKLYKELERQMKLSGTGTYHCPGRSRPRA